MKEDIKEVLLDEGEISEIVKKIGAQISKDYESKNLLLISVLKGSVVFMADLMRAIKIPCKIDFMVVSSYGDKAVSSGVVKIIKDLDINLSGYDLLIVEDILDTGRTLKSLMEILKTRNPNSVKICTFLDKPDRRAVDLSADYMGAQIPDEFVVGYGLDYDEKYRNLPYVGILKEEVYSN
ncbi:MAG: hypoxanthine phosphoribosyltransferase [Clostridia bacterium]|nr:hypoxanthine phosphoribosyltransferase [Clostridia bacterium]